MKSLRSIILVAVFFVGILWFQSLERQGKSQDSIGKATAIVESLPEYQHNSGFFDDKIAKHHRRAFEVAYKRERFNFSLDERSYQIVLLTLFMNDAEAAGHHEIYEAMRRELRKRDHEP